MSNKMFNNKLYCYELECSDFFCRTSPTAVKSFWGVNTHEELLKKKPTCELCGKPLTNNHFDLVNSLYLQKAY